MPGERAPVQPGESQPLELPGTPYRVLRLLGEGGMGQVFEVEHTVLGKVMVAKLLRAEFAGNVGLIDRMRVEAQALGALSHPNIVEVTDFGRTSDGAQFFVMERLQGATLGSELRKRRALPVPEAIEITCDVLSALEAAHQRGLVHRDIKLDNIFLHHAPGGERVVKVLDFGIAKVLQTAQQSGLAPPAIPTADGAIVGTPRYVSPEQILGRQVDHRADLYAVGIVLYTLVAGRGPFDSQRGTEKLFLAHLRHYPKPPSQVAAQPIPKALDAAILRALKKLPDERFESAAAFAAALRAVAPVLDTSRGDRDVQARHQPEEDTDVSAAGPPVDKTEPLAPGFVPPPAPSPPPTPTAAPRPEPAPVTPATAAALPDSSRIQRRAQLLAVVAAVVTAVVGLAVTGDLEVWRIVAVGGAALGVAVVVAFVAVRWRDPTSTR